MKQLNLPSPPPPPAALWRVLLAILGLLVVLGAYYWGHQRPVLEFVNWVRVPGMQLFYTLLLAFLVPLLLNMGWWVGDIVLGALDLDLTNLSRPERFALRVLLGLGLISHVYVLVGLFNIQAFLVILALMFLNLNWAGGSKWVQEIRATAAAARPQGRWQFFLAAVAAVALLSALARAFAPPTAWDALTYHLVGPETYLRAGQIVADPNNHFLGFPQGAELLYTPLLGTADNPLSFGPALLHFSFGVLGLLAVAGLTRRFSDRTAGWMAAVILLSAYSFWWLLGVPYVDLAAFAYGAAGICALVSWRESRNPRWLIIFGMVAALAIGVKYTAGMLLLAGLVFVLVRDRRGFPRAALMMIVTTVLVFSPWLVKGLVLYGNPIYPFVFNGLSWDAERAAVFSTFGRGLLAGPDAWQLALLPFSASVFGIERGAGFAFTTGVWWLFAPLIVPLAWPFLDARARTLARDLGWVALPMLVIWAFLAATSEIGQQTRLVMIGLPVAAALGGLGFYGLAHWPEKPVYVGFIVRVMLVPTLLFGLGEQLKTLVDERALGYLSGEVTADALLDHQLGAHVNAMRALGTLPADATVQFLWEPRTFYCAPIVRCQPDILFDRWARAVRAGGSAEGALDALRAEGIEYLLVWSAGYDVQKDEPAFADENALLPDALASLRVIWTDGIRYTVYGLE